MYVCRRWLCSNVLTYLNRIGVRPFLSTLNHLWRILRLSRVLPNCEGLAKLLLINCRAQRNTHTTLHVHPKIQNSRGNCQQGQKTPTHTTHNHTHAGELAIKQLQDVPLVVLSIDVRNFIMLLVSVAALRPLALTSPASAGS